MNEYKSLFQTKRIDTSLEFIIYLILPRLLAKNYRSFS